MQRLRAGELVEVRSKAEILMTLDQHGRLDGLPFMPEMFRYCGQRFRVYKRAHKTCDFVTHTGIRKLSSCGSFGGPAMRRVSSRWLPGAVFDILEGSLA